jgi:glutaminase
MNYAAILQDIYNEAKGQPKIGQVATSIPELASVPPDKFGMHLLTMEGEDFYMGDAAEKFSIQSVSKVLSG